MDEPFRPGSTQVGFVGLGNMGQAMARNLAAGGFSVTGYDIDFQAVQSFAGTAGCRAAAGPREVAGESDVLILMLPDGNVVRRFLFDEGPDGRTAAAALREGSVVVDMSSSAPLGTRTLGDEIARFGATLIDAPVSGGVKGARNGTLAIMVGGDEASAARMAPIFDVLGKTAIHVGPLGSGHAMKALNNYVSAAGLVAACEALEVAKRFGIQGERAIEVLNASTGRNNSTENKLAQFVLSESYDSGFSLGLMRKDLATALELARRLGLEVDLATEVVALWERAETALGGGADHTEIGRLVRRAI